jgi:cytochrome c-type biogenesis protein CcmH
MSIAIKGFIRLIALLALLGAAGVHAVPPGTPLEFASEAEQDRYTKLVKELRCTVCQNQSLVDSNAPLAQDLRHQVYNMIREGADEAAVVEFMVARYGDFVLYRPPFTPVTYALWLGPLALFAIGAAVFATAVRRRRTVAAGELSESERHRLEQLLRREEDYR